MKILRVIDTLDARTGGPAVGLRALTPVLQAQGHETVIVTMDAPGSSETRIPGVEVMKLGPARNRYRRSPALAIWLMANVARFDLIVVHGLWQDLGRSVRRAALRHSVPYFVYPHGMLDPWFRRAYPQKHLKKWLYWQLVERRVLRDAAAVLFTCEEERRLARLSFAPYVCTERVVNYGTAGAPPDTDRQRAAWAARRPALHGQPYLLFLGRLHAKKGVDLLLEAWLGLAAREDSPPALVIAGPPDDPELVARLKARVAESPAARGRVVWAGMLEGDVKWGALRGAEALVLPSHQENFGLSVVEALSVGTPVLLTHQVNIWREITGDEAGLAADDTLSGISGLLDSWQALPPPRRAVMRRNAAACYQQRFHIEAVARSFVRVTSDFLPAASLPASAS